AKLLLDGTPVSLTEFANDPVTPVRHSHIPTLLSEYSRRAVATIGASVVSAGTAAVVSRVNALRGTGVRLIVADATRDVHLDRLARASSLVRHPILLCGSAGLAAGLARATPSAAARTELPQGGRAVVVVGSTNAIATRQVQRLGCAPGWRVL